MYSVDANSDDIGSTRWATVVINCLLGVVEMCIVHYGYVVFCSLVWSSQKNVVMWLYGIADKEMRK